MDHVHDFHKEIKDMMGENVIGKVVMASVLVSACKCGEIEEVEKVLQPDVRYKRR